MALQVWLPLNKNGADKNQGLGNSVVTNFGAVYENSGKLGGCYKCTNSAGINIESKPWMKMVPGNSFSVSMWIKGCSENTWLIACRSWEIIFRTNVLAVYPGGSIENGGCSVYQTFDTNTWYHIAFSYDGNTSKLSLYLNGEFKQEYITTFRQDSINSTITLPYGDTRYINDFRIYDHCLSPKEVKEISKGLVLHYPLNDRYIENTTNLFGNISTSWEGFTMQKYPVDSANIPYIDNNGDLVLLGNGSGRQTYITSLSRIGWTNVKPNTTYTISTYAYLGTGASYIMYFYENDGTTSASTTTAKSFTGNNEWRLCSITITTKSTTTRMYCELNNGTSSILNSILILKSCSLQLEEKDHATPYTPNTRNETTVYDCSGYQNNGTISGSLSCSTDSPRYKFSSTTTSDFSILRPGGYNVPEGPLTVSFWQSPLDKTYANNENTSNTNIRFGKFYYFNYLNYPYFYYNGMSRYRHVNYWADGKWHMVTCVFDGTTSTLYIDGETVSGIQTGTNSDTNTYTSNIDISSIRNSLSDFRIYATALSAEDIKELYNTSCIINS